MRLNERDRNCLFVLSALALVGALGAVAAFELGWL